MNLYSFRRAKPQPVLMKTSIPITKHSMLLMALTTALLFLADSPSVSAQSGLLLAKDTFDRPDNEDLGTTEIGKIPWVSFGTSGPQGGVKAKPEIQKHRLWFSSSVVGRDAPEQEVGVGLMAAFLRERLKEFTLSTKLEFATRAPGDGWLGIGWGRSRLQASAFDPTGYMLKIAPGGNLVLFYNTEVVAQGKTALSLGKPVDIRIISTKEKTTIFTNGETTFSLPTSTPPEVYEAGGYVAFLSHHNGLGASGPFERGIHSVEISEETR